MLLFSCNDIDLPLLQQKGFSVILSDMCPLVSGITTKDAALSAELGMRALDLAVGRAAYSNPDNDIKGEEVNGYHSSPADHGVLRPGGNLIIKLLESEDAQGSSNLVSQLLCSIFSRKEFASYYFRLSAEFMPICKPLFTKASWLRPKATRSSSREIYLICQGLQL